MQTTPDTNFVIGTFKRELRNRFLCEVEIDNADVVCYVPSSCHLANFLQLEGRKVLLVPTKTMKSRTSLSLFAVPYKRNYIVLNPSMANRALEHSIRKKCFSFLGNRTNVIREHIVDGYKSDLFLPASNTILEIKSVISIANSATFPTVYSERTINQMQAIYTMLLKGYRVCLAIVSLHPYVNCVKIDNATDFYAALAKCLSAGLVVKAYTCRLRKGSVLIDREIPVEC